MANAQAKVASAKVATVICSALTRPKRSPSAPPNQPPNAPKNSVIEPSRPASALLMPNAAISAGIARPNIWTSSASSAQPPKLAQNVRRSSGELSLYQFDMLPTPHALLLDDVEE